MHVDEAARIALQMVTLPPDINLYQAIALSLTQPLLGRG